MNDYKDPRNWTYNARTHEHELTTEAGRIVIFRVSYRHGDPYYSIVVFPANRAQFEHRRATLKLAKLWAVRWVRAESKAAK